MDIGIDLNRKYLSFHENLECLGLNKFAILTGTNGAGKSQLLQMLNTKPLANGQTPPFTAEIVIDGGAINSDDVLGIFDWSMPGAQVAGMAEIQADNTNLYSAVINRMNNQSQEFDTNIYTREQITELHNLVNQLLSQGYNGSDNQPTILTVKGLLSPEFNKRSKQILNERIAKKIYDWHFDAQTHGRPIDSTDNPISIFNNLCTEFGLKFSLPPLTDYSVYYSPTLINAAGDDVDWSGLSSGEKVIFRLICWLFYFRLDEEMYPKVVLLDEPDAHLTPKMIRVLLKTLQEIVLDKMDINVLLTTHSPNTIALSPEASLYELTVDRTQHAIIKITRSEALKKMAEGLLFVEEDLRLVFVEGKDDVPFYEINYREAINRHNFTTIPPLQFIAASVADADRGGVEQVKTMVDRFNDTSITRLVHGIIDRDVSNVSSGNVHVIGRYSIESYLYDPILIVVSTIIQNKHPALFSNVSGIEPGDTSKIILTPPLRQRLIDEVVAECYRVGQEAITNGSYSSELVEVQMYVRNRQRAIKYNLPKWWLDLPKDELLRIIRSADNKYKTAVTSNGQLLAIQTIGGVSKDLIEVLNEVKSN